jgi:hypothetical protein
MQRKITQDEDDDEYDSDSVCPKEKSPQRVAGFDFKSDRLISELKS